MHTHYTEMCVYIGLFHLHAHTLHEMCVYIYASFTSVHTRYTEMCVYIGLFHLHAHTLHRDVCIYMPLSQACTHVTQDVCLYRPLSRVCTHYTEMCVYIGLFHVRAHTVHRDVCI